jgi:hypothetical protein
MGGNAFSVVRKDLISTTLTLFGVRIKITDFLYEFALVKTAFN